MKVLKVFVDFADAMKELNEAERGRLFMAMLEYARSGAEPVFRGNEKVLWPVAKGNIDNQQKAYDHICAVNKNNVTNRYEPLRTVTIRSEPKQDKEKEKRKKYIDDEDDEDEVSDARAEDPILRLYDQAAAAVRAAYMASVGIPPSNGEVNRLTVSAVNNGMVDLLAEAIDQAARNGARNIPGYAITLLEEWSGQGIRTQKDLVRYQRIMQQARDGDLSAAEAYTQLKGARG